MCISLESLKTLTITVKEPFLGKYELVQPGRIPLRENLCYALYWNLKFQRERALKGQKYTFNIQASIGKVNYLGYFLTIKEHVCSIALIL